VEDVVRGLARWQLPEVNGILARIAISAEFPEEVRTVAQYERFQWFGTEILDLKFEMVKQGLEEALAPPYPIEVTLKNTSGKTLEFSYDAPSEIIGIFLQQRQNQPGGGEFLSPKPGVAWFQGAKGPGRKSIKLLAGKSHKVRMNLADYFEIPSGLNGLIVWVACSLPGLHEVPQQCGEGLGF
jgi:YD repeat-containing protein